MQIREIIIIIQGALRESLARRLFYELISGINHLHINHIVHRDIKCENLLITLDGTVKIADFGFARQLERGQCLSDTYCGSTAYTAPEILAATVSRYMNLFFIKTHL